MSVLTDQSWRFSLCAGKPNWKLVWMQRCLLGWTRPAQTGAMGRIQLVPPSLDSSTLATPAWRLSIFRWRKMLSWSSFLYLRSEEVRQATYDNQIGLGSEKSRNFNFSNFSTNFIYYTISANTKFENSWTNIFPYIISKTFSKVFGSGKFSEIFLIKIEGSLSFQKKHFGNILFLNFDIELCLI